MLIRRPAAPSAAPRGFTLIEVLVTLVILTFGLLGIAGLMAKGQRASYEAYQRQQALALANDMAERIRANRAMAQNYADGAPVGTPLGGAGSFYNDLLLGTITDCGGGSACSAANLATYDLAMWDGLLTGYTEKQVVGGASIGGIVNAVGCVELANTVSACPNPEGFSNLIYRGNVAWQGNEDTVAPTLSACGNGLYGTAARRRLVSLDVMISNPC